MKLQFIGNCVGNPFSTVEELSNIIDNAREIKKETFLKHCDIDIMPRICTYSLEEAMKKFPYDFTFYKFKKIYFYAHSSI